MKMQFDIAGLLPFGTVASPGRVHAIQALSGLNIKALIDRLASEFHWVPLDCLAGFDLGRQTIGAARGKRHPIPFRDFFLTRRRTPRMPSTPASRLAPWLFCLRRFPFLPKRHSLSLARSAPLFQSLREFLDLRTLPANLPTLFCDRLSERLQLLCEPLTTWAPGCQSATVHNGGINSQTASTRAHPFQGR